MKSHEDVDGPGFYVDDNEVDSMRYWNGAAWTDERFPFVLPRNEPLSFGASVLAIALGVLIALFVAQVLFGMA